jgi:hypothetical protein
VVDSNNTEEAEEDDEQAEGIASKGGDPFRVVRRGLGSLFWIGVINRLSHR